jgi:hypothetical protein
LVFECPIRFSLAANYDRPEAMCQASLTRAFMGQLRVDGCSVENILFLLALSGGASVLASRLGPAASFFKSHPAMI